MPSPGDKVFKISSIMLDETGKRSRITVAVGVVPASGKVDYAAKPIMLDLSGAEFDALRAAVEAKLAASPPSVIAGAILE